MKKLFAVFPLLLLCSCVSPTETPVQPPPTPPELYPWHTALKGAVPNLVVAPQPKYCTNILHVQWNAPVEPGLTSYKFYIGTNTGVYPFSVQLGSDTNYFMTNVDAIISTNPYVYTTTYPDGSITTNVDRMHLAVTAQYDVATLLQVFGPPIIGVPDTQTNGIAESDYSAELVWPPYPPPPWSALVFTWIPAPTGGNSPNSVIANPVRNVTLLSSTTLGNGAQWQTITNVTGTNVMIPLPSDSLFFRGVTTDLPPVQLQINGGYIHGTN